MKKWLKRRGFTDRLYALNLILTWSFTLFCMIITVFQNNLGIVDFSIVNSGLPVVWGELSIHTGFVIWKSKAENMAKFNKKDDIQM